MVMAISSASIQAVEALKKEIEKESQELKKALEEKK